MARGRRRAGLALALAACVAVGCGHADALGGRLAALEAKADEARSLGARRCAPQELALADTHARLARDALARADLDDAADHLTLGEPNAGAAVTLAQEGCPDPPPGEGARPR